MPRDSIISSLIRAAAERLAADQRLPSHVRTHVRDAWVSELRSFTSTLCGERVYVGARVTLVPRKRDSKRAERIAAALSAGDAVDEIARREGVTRRYVLKVRAASSAT